MDGKLLMNNGEDHKFFLKILFAAMLVAFILAYLAPFLGDLGIWPTVEQ